MPQTLVVWNDTGEDPMVKLTLRISDELHEKLRWLAYKKRRSQQAILLQLVEKALSKVRVPEEKER